MGRTPEQPGKSRSLPAHSSLGPADARHVGGVNLDRPHEERHQFRGDPATPALCTRAAGRVRWLATGVSLTANRDPTILLLQLRGGPATSRGFGSQLASELAAGHRPNASPLRSPRGWPSCSGSVVELSRC
ncbi:hypothetical protein VFPBJ_08676 [Purpureocillium lilacinum]|uniref:Uncharacterized protein n=1 Tax=Purpureocillium lilacinum TaxID=33203 RepID=A0A179GEQ1_PURLI|nr:hypothetical protein VFPBJ_08676 [Purpureocillium lilacinum]